MKKKLIILPLALLFISAAAESRVSVSGFVGERIDACIENMVIPTDVEELVAPFRSKDDSWSWKTEFAGKWLLGAIASYEYKPSEELLSKINYVAESLMATQLEDGYIGNYSPESRLCAWDIWGRKYTALSLLSYYRLSGKKAVLDAVAGSIDCLINELDSRQVDISLTGNYFGMASCSILEPVVLLYKESGNTKYLDFAKDIASKLEQEGSARLVSKALDGVPVSERSAQPSNWWSFENGQKAYEMMSCYEGLVELGDQTGEGQYYQAALRTIESIISDEINIAGSGAAFECWYKGKQHQTRPAYHTMETCVTFTWMQFCARMLAKSHDARFADQFERTMYNALIASMKDDGSQISKYSPLEGHRFEGEQQCGLHINCCNANGPRGFALIPSTVYTLDDNCLYVNLYLPSEGEFKLGKRKLGISTQTLYPLEGQTQLVLNPDRAMEFSLALRVPDCVSSFAVSINGEDLECQAQAGFVYIARKWKKGDKVSISMDIPTELVLQDHCQAIVHGPVVFARDSRFDEGDIDEACVIQCDSEGKVQAKLSDVRGKSFCWLEMEVPMILGTNLEDEHGSGVHYVKFCDFASAGNDWEHDGRYRVWLPQTINVMTEQYHSY